MVLPSYYIDVLNRTWWWDSWVAPNNLYSTFDGISQFVKEIGSLADYQWEPIMNATISVATVRLYGMYGYKQMEQTGLAVPRTVSATIADLFHLFIV